MTEQEKQEIENLISEECAEDDFIIGGKIQTLLSRQRFRLLVCGGSDFREGAGDPQNRDR